MCYRVWSTKEQRWGKDGQRTWQTNRDLKPAIDKETRLAEIKTDYRQTTGEMLSWAVPPDGGELWLLISLCCFFFLWGQCVCVRLLTPTSGGQTQKKQKKKAFLAAFVCMLGFGLALLFWIPCAKSAKKKKKQFFDNRDFLLRATMKCVNYTSVVQLTKTPYSPK